MKKLLKLAVMAVGALSFQSAYAFHSGGVAECNGCHTMHNSLEGVAADDNMAQFSSGPYLLKGNDQSSACLNCHSGPTLSGYHVATYPASAATKAPVNLTPGGDFDWVKKTYTWEPRTGTTETSPGDRHGHNIVAVDFGFAADATLTVAPGGTYPADNLACSSCHDPHGKYRRLKSGAIVDGKGTDSLPIANSGSYFTSNSPTDFYAVGVYRILGGKNYQPKSLAGTFGFPSDPPAAVAPSSYNRTEAVSQTKVAYGTGMSEWCANCHTQIHENAYKSGTAGLTHPSGSTEVLDSFIVNNYNQYVATGKLDGTPATAWNSLVPFEEGSADYDTATTGLKAKAADLSGPESGTENVMCLSCHRVHASGFTSMLRWSLDYEFMSNGDAAGKPVFTSNAVKQGKSAEEITAAYYGRETSFAGYQRALCNKCHVKD